MCEMIYIIGLFIAVLPLTAKGWEHPKGLSVRTP